MFRILYSPRFNREYKKLFTLVQEKAMTTIDDLRIDPFAPHLKTHKLQGNLQKFYACSVTYSYRIIFEFIENQTILLRSVGDHSIYD